MRVNVIGYGTVGKAQEFLLKKLGHEVFVFDPYVFPDVKSPEKQVELTFVCTPGNVVPDAPCMDELITAFHGEGLNPLLFEAVKTYNLRIQNTHDNT